MSGKGGGFLGFGGKPQLSLCDTGISWMEGKEKKFVDFSQIKQLKFSKYYSTLSIIHSETKKVTLLNIGMFETIWTDFARKKSLQIRLTAE
jgi:hypothetical protein